MAPLSHRTLKVLVATLSVAVFALAVTAGWMGATRYKATAPSIESGNLPLAVVKIVIPKDRYDVALAAIREFAQVNGFATRIAATTPDGDKVGIDLWRGDVKILGDNSLFTTDFSFGFYKNGHAIPVADSDELKARFVDAMRRVDGVILSEAK